MQESMRFCHMTHSMKRIKILLSHYDMNKFKNRDSVFPLVQCFKTTFCYIFYSMFLDYYLFHLVQCFKIFLLSHTQKNSLHFHSPCPLLLLYIHMPITLHTIPSQIHSDKKRCHLLSTYVTLTLWYHLILTCMSRL